MKVEELIRNLAHEDSEIRDSAVESFGAVGEDAVPDLIRLLQHQDKDLCRGAAWALGQIGDSAKDAVPTLCLLYTSDAADE